MVGLTIKEIQEKDRSSRKYTSFHHQLQSELAFYFTKIFLYLPFTPNQITVIWIILQLGSTFILLKGTYWSILLGVFLFQFFFVIDAADGQIARIRNKKSLSGIYLDGLGHNIANPLFFIFLSIGASLWRENIVYFFFGIGGAVSYGYNRILAINPFWFKEKDRELINKNFSYAMRKQSRWDDFMRIQFPFNLLFFGVLIGFAHIMVIIYSLIFFTDAVRKIISIIKTFKKVDSEYNKTN